LMTKSTFMDMFYIFPGRLKNDSYRLQLAREHRTVNTVKCPKFDWRTLIYSLPSEAL
jgi:hypothetical protein